MVCGLVSVPSTSAIVLGLSFSRPEPHSSPGTQVFKKITRAGMIVCVNDHVSGHRTCGATSFRERLPLHCTVFRTVRLIYIDRSLKWVLIAREYCLFEATSNTIQLQDVVMKIHFSSDESV